MHAQLCWHSNNVAECVSWFLGVRREAICVKLGGGSSSTLLTCNTGSAQLRSANEFEFAVVPARLHDVPPFPGARCGPLHGSATVSFPRTGRTVSAALPPSPSAAVARLSSSSGSSVLGRTVFRLTPEEAADIALGDYDAVFQHGSGSRYASADNFLTTLTGAVTTTYAGPTTAYVGALCLSAMRCTRQAANTVVAPPSPHHCRS